MRVWIPETDKILRNMWPDQPPAVIASAVNAYLGPLIAEQKKQIYVTTTRGGVVWRAFVLGLINAEEREDHYRRIRNENQKRRSRRTRQDRIALDGGECQNCGSGADLVVHHWIPVCVGGPDSLANTITLCGACHRELHRGVYVFPMPGGGS